MSDQGGTRRRATRRLQGFESWSEGENNALARIAEGLVVPGGVAAAQLSPKARIFAIGPDFARRLEGELVRAGVQVTSLMPESPIREIARTATHGHLNKFSPASVRQELDWAAGAKAFPREGLVPLGDAFVDPYLHERAAHGGAQALVTRRSAIGRYFARAFAAEMVVIALETTETWYDRRTRLALNNPPLQKVYDVEPERFTVRRLDTEEVRSHLRAIAARLRKRNAKQCLVLMVSPVPPERTYSREDVIVANLASKSVLHAACTEFAAATEGVEYFPSYEAVMASDPARVWQPDRRGLSEEILRALAEAFVERFGLLLGPDSLTVGSA